MFSISAATEREQDDFLHDRLGRYPQIWVDTLGLYASSPLRRVWNPQCNDEKKLFLAPFGPAVESAGPMILDAQGRARWLGAGRGSGSTTSVQLLRGQPYLSYWTGTRPSIGIGEGFYELLDTSYELSLTIRAANNRTADFHDFSITGTDTALFTIYTRKPTDLAPKGGPSNGWTWDSGFQEVDPYTGELVFEWLASNYFSSTDCYYSFPAEKENAGTWNAPWDWFHINSVEKDTASNYLVSSRYLKAVVYVSGGDGRGIWSLGGKNNSFLDRSDGKATEFGWQHDARFVDNGTSVTIFDNRGTTTQPGPFAPARGIKVALNMVERQAKLDYEVVHPDKFRSKSQGSLQQLSNGNYLINYGSTAAVTEFDSTGRVVCDLALASLFSGPNGAFRANGVGNYRTSKQTWIGRPSYPPSALIRNNTLQVSWNGATEVQGWSLSWQDVHGARHKSADVAWESIETSMALPNSAWRSLQLCALDGKGGIEGQWLVQHSQSEANDSTSAFKPTLTSVTEANAGLWFTEGSWWCYLLILGLVAVFNKTLFRRRHNLTSHRHVGNYPHSIAVPEKQYN